MKKSILFVTMCLFCQIQILAQKWSIDEHEADELRGSESYTSYCYDDENENSFVFWSNSDKNFRIITNSGVFDYKSSFAGKIHTRLMNVVVGIYDTQDKLIEKYETKIEVADDIKMASKPWATKKAKKILEYIKEQQGYIRILASIYGSNLPFEIKVPCLKNQLST